MPFTIAPHGRRVESARPGHHDGRRHLRPSLPRDERPRRACDQGPHASTSTARKLTENFVVLSRIERRDRDHARSRGAGAPPRGPRDDQHHPQASALLAGSAGSRRVSRAVVAGAFSAEFLSLPEEVLTTTLIHHQHYFPGRRDRAAQLMPAFLAVIEHAVDERARHRDECRARRHRAAARCAVFLGRRSQGRRSRRGSSGSATRAVPQEPRDRTARRPSGSRRWRRWIAT